MTIRNFSQPIWLIVLIIFAVSSCSNNETNVPKAKYVFLFVGDGMGFQQVTATQAYIQTTKGDVGNHNLSFTQFPATGYVSTYSSNRYITDSAAAGTAIACGEKTTPGTIGLGVGYSDTLFSVAHSAFHEGFKVGIATSVSIDHATPASFYAHQQKRSMYHRIAHDLIQAQFHFYASGGFLDPAGEKCKTPFGDVLTKAKEKGFYLTTFLNLPDSIVISSKTIIYTSPNPAPSSTLKYQIDVSAQDVTLSDITKLGTSVLSNPNGFFYMIEGGKIDWACHDNDAATVIHEMQAFSSAVQTAVDFYNNHPSETLIIVTSDHETGGMSIGNSLNGYDTNLSLLSNQKCSMETLNGIVKSFLSQYNGKPTFDQVLDFIASEKVIGINQDQLSANQIDDIRAAYRVTVSNLPDVQKKIKSLYGSNEPIAAVAVNILNQMAGIGWTSNTHTGSLVPLYALGVGHELFVGQMDNTDISRKIAKAMGLKTFK